MPASPARRTALTVLRRVEEQGAYADRALHGDARDLDPRDRALAKRLVFGTVQRRGTLDWIIAQHVDRQLDPQVRAALLLGLYQLLYTEVADSRRGRRVGRAGQAEPRRQARQRGPAQGPARGRASCPPTTRPRAPRSATRTPSG